MLELLGAVGGIVLVDLALSGDNALVIGAAAAGLPREQRRVAIIAGGAGAIVLRITCAIAATLLLALPLLQAIGGLVLLAIAVRLLMARGGEQTGSGAHGQRAERSFMGALLTILVADVTMSLDNVLAVGALAHGNLPLLAVGLLLSMGLLLVGSSLVAALMGRLPWLLDVAAVVLGWTAGNMPLHDQRLGPLFSTNIWTQILVHAVPIALVLIADLYLRRRVARARQR